MIRVTCRPFLWNDQTPLRPSFLLALALAALAVRLLNLALSGGDPGFHMFPDSASYLPESQRWLQDGSLSDYLQGRFNLPPERVPGYFWFLSSVIWLFGSDPMAVALVQAVVDAGTCVLIALLARPLGPVVARAAGVLAAVWPNLVIHSTLILQDSLYLFLLTLVMLALTAYARQPSVAKAAGCGLLMGVALLVRNDTQFLAPVLAVGVAVVAWRRLDWRRGMAAGLVFCLLLPMPLAPVLYRNITVFGSSSLSTQSGLHALFWTMPLVRMGETGRAFSSETQDMQRKFQLRMEQEGIDPAALNPFQLDRQHRAMALEELLATNPFYVAKAWVQGAVVNLMSPALLSDGRVRSLPRPSFYEVAGSNLPERAWRYFFSDFGWFQAIVLAGLAAAVPATILQAAGLWLLMRRQPLAGWCALALIGYFLALSGPTAAPKYRLAFEPVLIIALALVLGTVCRRAAVHSQASSTSRAT